MVCQLSVQVCCRYSLLASLHSLMKLVERGREEWSKADKWGEGVSWVYDHSLRIPQVHAYQHLQKKTQNLNRILMLMA